MGGRKEKRGIRKEENEREVRQLVKSGKYGGWGGGEKEEVEREGSQPLTSMYSQN